VTLRFAGDAADGVVQAARLVARGFATQGFPVETRIHPTSAIRAEPGTPGGYLAVDLVCLLPQKAVMPRLVDTEGDTQGTGEGIQGLVLFRPVSLARAIDGLASGAWVLLDADSLSAKQLAGDPDSPFPLAGETPLEFHPVSFLNLPRDLDMDRNWRRTQRLLTPREQNRCRAFTPVGWIAGQFGLPMGAWDLWVGDRFRNHPPLREMALTLIRAGHQAGENGSNENILVPFAQPPLMPRGVWRMATAYEALALGLAQAARNKRRIVHLCVPLDPVLTPLIRSARVLSDHGLRIIEGSTPIESVRNALGVFLAGGIGVSVGASPLDPGFQGRVLRPGGRWIRLEEAREGVEPRLNHPSDLERFGRSIHELADRVTATYCPSIWQREEPIALEGVHFGGPKDYPSEMMSTGGAQETEPSTGGAYPVETSSARQTVSRTVPEWCPGCGNFAILEHFAKVLTQTGNGEKAILAAPGCAGKIIEGLGWPAYNCAPGAVFGIARGVCAAWPGAELWIVAGDGELSGPSLGGLVRAIHENQPVKILFVNNETAASADGLETLLTPAHSWDEHRDSSAQGPMPLAGIMIIAGAGYYARAMDVEVETLAQSLRGAGEHQGTAIVEVWQNCKVHNDGNHDDMIDRQISRRHRIDLAPGRPITFDFEPERCLVWTGSSFESRVLLTVPPEDVVVHDPRDIHPLQAVALASLGVAKPAEASCFGVMVARPREKRRSSLSIKEIRTNGWLTGPDAWVIPDYPEFPTVEGTA